MSLAVSPEPTATAGIDATIVNCGECFFGASDLCSLPRQEKCSTFRPNDFSKTAPPASKA